MHIVGIKVDFLLALATLLMEEGMDICESLEERSYVCGVLKECKGFLREVRPTLKKEGMD